MPFSGLFKTEFEVGDLIFGLADVRARYVDKNPFFSKAKSHFNKGGYPPIYIDQYLTLAEIFRGITTDIYIKKRINRNEFVESKYTNAIGRFNQKLEYNKSKHLGKYKKALASHLGNNPKYKTVLEDFEYNRCYLGRKCKGALSFICENNDQEIAKDVHFILDDIEYDKVVYKLDTNITGRELRFLYRNRSNPNISNKVQFWIYGKPTSPPWENDIDDLWKNYITQEEKASPVAGVASLLDGIRR